MSATKNPETKFWIIGIFALLWNAMGVWSYISQAYDMEYATKGLSKEQISLMDSMPVWYTALFAIAVFTGFFGSVALLMRKVNAIMLFIASFIAAAIVQAYWLYGTDAPIIFSDHMPYLMPILVVVFGLVFILFSKNQKVKGVLS